MTVDEANARKAETIKICVTVNKVENLRETRNVVGRFGKNRGSGKIRQTSPLVRGCGEPWQRGGTGEAESRVWPVWAEVAKDVLRGYLQRENSMGSDTTAAVLGANPTILACRKKYKIKGGGR